MKKSKSLNLPVDMVTFKKIFALSLPVMIGMMLQSLLTTVDMLFISRLGTTEAAAASLGASAYGVILVLSALVYSGTIAITARRFGEGNMDAVDHCTADSTVLSVVIGVLVGGLAYIFSEDLVVLMFNPDPETLHLSVIYLKVIFLGTAPVFAATSLRSSLQGIGDTKTPLWIFGFSNIINMALCPLFIYTFDGGIAGAAYAMLVANVFSFIAIGWVVFRKIFKSDYRRTVIAFVPNPSRYWSILKIGGWSALQQVARPITGMLMYRMVFMAGGQEATAAFGIGGQLFNYTFIFLVGISVGISIVTGQSLGEGEWSKAKRFIDGGLVLCFINMVIFIVPYMILPETIMGLFIADPVVIRTGAEYLRVIYLGLWTVAYTMAYSGAFQGAGKTFPPMIASMVANVVMKVPLAYVLAFPLRLGTMGVWISVSLSVVVEAVMIIWYYKSHDWEAEIHSVV